MTSKGSQLIKTVFNTDNKVMRVCERIFDFVCLNLIFLLSCLPLLTIGAAKIALYTVLEEMRNQQHVTVIKSYVDSFKSSLKLGLILFSFEILYFGIIILDLWFIYRQTTLPFLVMKIICLGLLFLGLLFSQIIYPLAKQHRGDIISLFKMTLLQISFNMLRSFLLLAILLVVFLLYLSTSVTLVFGTFYLIIAGFSNFAYLQIVTIEKMKTPQIVE